ncbi:MAG: hypothetical protein ACF8PG_06280 [Maioricimonas sp. JB045]|uniref:hypothetical protein n=1 Tax=Maioricimonas sp. JC845 TaxID=3232138 RepID=UPI003458F877
MRVVLYCGVLFAGLFTVGCGGGAQAPATEEEKQEIKQEMDKLEEEVSEELPADI